MLQLTSFLSFFFFFLNKETKISIKAKHQSNLEAPDLLLNGHKEDTQWSIDGELTDDSIVHAGAVRQSKTLWIEKGETFPSSASAR